MQLNWVDRSDREETSCLYGLWRLAWHITYKRELEPFREQNTQQINSLALNEYNRWYDTLWAADGSGSVTKLCLTKMYDVLPTVVPYSAFLFSRIGLISRRSSWDFCPLEQYFPLTIEKTKDLFAEKENVYPKRTSFLLTGFTLVLQHRHISVHWVSPFSLSKKIFCWNFCIFGGTSGEMSWVSSLRFDGVVFAQLKSHSGFGEGPNDSLDTPLFKISLLLHDVQLKSCSLCVQID